MICVYVDAEKAFDKWCGPYKMTEMTNSEFETMETTEQQSIDIWIDIVENGDTVYGIYRAFVWQCTTGALSAVLIEFRCFRQQCTERETETHREK